LARSTTSRAHLLGAEAARLEAQWKAVLKPAYVPYDQLYEAGRLRQAEAATRRRYWRELAAAAALQGQPWPEAEALGEEVR
jgi:hypothetical protein